LREGGTRCLQRVAKIDAALPPDILGLGDKANIVLRGADPSSMLAREWINDPRPVFRSRAQTGDYRILADVIKLCCKLSSAFVRSQPMIEISFLPDDVIESPVEPFPVSDDFAHWFGTRKREHRVQMIRH